MGEHKLSSVDGNVESLQFHVDAKPLIPSRARLRFPRTPKVIRGRCEKKQFAQSLPAITGRFVIVPSLDHGQELAKALLERADEIAVVVKREIAWIWYVVDHITTHIVRVFSSRPSRRPVRVAPHPLSVGSSIAGPLTYHHEGHEEHEGIRERVVVYYLSDLFR